MERLDATAPPIVAVMVIHHPDVRLAEALDSLATQDYPDLRVLLLVAGDDADVAPVRQLAAERLPAAVVRSLGGNPGFGPACNVALDLVEGDRGFFLVMHDDVALDPHAVRCLVEEMYRSNAGIVGPKLVEWDDPRRLHRVGLGVDRIGEIDPLVEPGELDQEQHDAVRDMFALPSACLLIRADLLRLLRFDPDIDFHGDDVDLCWRAHLTGARVLLVPAARARHRSLLPERRPDLAHRALMARHRVWSVATLTGARRLPGVLMRLVVVTLAELIAGTVTGRARQSWSVLVAVAGLVPRLPRVVARRRRIRSLRIVPEGEVAYLQMRGSARLQRYRRARQAAAVRRHRHQDAAPEASRSAAATALTWLVALAFVLVGSRRLLLDGVAPVGEMLPFGSSPVDLLSRYLTPWWGSGIGGDQAMPTGVGLLGVAGVVAFGNMGLLHTLTTVGLLVVGLWGLWRIGARLHSDVGQRVCMLGGVLVPFGIGALAAGRWSALVLWAATPWWIDAIVATPPDRVGRRRNLAAFVMSVALVAAFVPAVLVVVPLLGLVLALGTALGHDGRVATGLAAAGRGLLRSLVAVAGAVALNLPWAWGVASGGRWDDVVRAGQTGTTGVGWWSLVQWGRSGVALAALSALVLVPAVAVVLLARQGRAVWGLRSAGLVGGFGLVTVVADRDMLPFPLGDVWWYVAPVAVGAAVALGTLAAAWRDDVVTRSFGWRQPLGLLAAAAAVIAALGPLLAAVDGRWEQPRSAIPVLLEQLPRDDPAGEYRVLFVGDERVLGMRSWPLGDGLGFSVVDDGPLTTTEVRWLPVPNAAVRSVHEAFDAVAADATGRLGRLLAPLGVRFVVVPVLDGVVSTAEAPLEAPVGLLDRLGRQLDLRRRSGTAELVIFENAAWLPTRAVLTGSTAEATQRAGAEVLVDVPFDERLPLRSGAAVTVEPGAVVHAGVPRSAGWRLDVDGQPMASRTAFGTVTAWDLPAGGTVRLRLDEPRDPVRWVIVAVQASAWTILAGLAVGWRRRHRRAGVTAPTEVLVHLDGTP